MTAATRRRAKGTIQKLPSGALRVRVYSGYDSVTGRRNYLTETIPASPTAEKDAEAARVRLVNQVNERRNPRTKATVTQLIEKYLEVANLDPATRRGYERNLRNHIRPFLGSRQASKIDAQVLDSFYAELRRCRAHCDRKRQVDHRTARPHDCDHRCTRHQCRPLAPSTVRRIHFLLSGAFSRAVRWGWITVNPATMAEPPAEPAPNPQPPTPDQAARILNAAASDPDWYALIWTLMTTGARRGELCAVRWCDLDLSTGTLKVHRSVDQNGSQRRIKDTKTHQHRRIALDAETITVLTEQRDRCEQRAAKLESELSDEGYVFSLAPDGSTPVQPDTVTQRYRRLAQQLGIKTTVHKLRHYSATELIAAGVDARTVGGRLGHAGGGATTLRVYSAWVAESDQRAASSLSTRMPTRPTSSQTDRAERAKYDPKTPHEKIAAEIRQDILDGKLSPGTLAPTQQEIQRTHYVSAGTASRVVELLKEWSLVEATRGRRATVCPAITEQASESAAVERLPEPSTEAPEKTLLDLRLVCLGETVRTFSADADPTDRVQLRRLLAGATRRHGGKNADIADYELEVRRQASPELITTFAALD